MTYRIQVSPAADRDLFKLKGKIQRRDFERLRGAIKSLALEPRPDGVRKLRGEELTYRIRVGDYRVVYDVYDREKMVLLLQVVRRSGTTYQKQ